MGFTFLPPLSILGEASRNSQGSEASDAWKQTLPAQGLSLPSCIRTGLCLWNSQPTQRAKHTGRPVRITPDFSTETMKARRSWTDVIQTLRENKCQPRLLYPAKFSITIDQDIPGQNQIYTISDHKSSPTKNNRQKTQQKEENYNVENARK